MENNNKYDLSFSIIPTNDNLQSQLQLLFEVRFIANSQNIAKVPLEAFVSNGANGNWGAPTQKSSLDIEIQCVRGADFSSFISEYSFMPPTRFISPKNVDSILSNGDFIVEISGGSPTQSTGRIVYVTDDLLSRSEYPVGCSNFCKKVSLKDLNYQFWFYYMWSKLYSSNAMFNFEGKTTGIKNLMFDMFLKEVKVPNPDYAAVCEFQSICQKNHSIIQKNLRQSQYLANIRDYILPLLMNGQVSITD